ERLSEEACGSGHSSRQLPVPGRHHHVRCRLDGCAYRDADGGHHGCPPGRQSAECRRIGRLDSAGYSRLHRQSRKRRTGRGETQHAAAGNPRSGKGPADFQCRTFCQAAFRRVLFNSRPAGSQESCSLIKSNEKDRMKTIAELYETHDGNVSDKWTSYFAFYERAFSPIRNKPVRLLEVGIQNGGSLEIWGKYFSNAQKLLGCDINPNCRKIVHTDPR